MTGRAAASAVDAFERALGEIRTRVSVSAMAVAYSGGLDSAALLHLAHQYAAGRGIALFAFHVHHGLSPNADDWLAHCEQECARLGVRFAARRISLVGREKGGIEQAARTGRYAALGEMCQGHGAQLLLTAHHQDDQAETLLLQMLRGSGIAGLSGMERATAANHLLGDAGLVIVRPLLDVSRQELECFVAQHDIRYVEDESNSDVRYARNALRHKVMPALAEFFPGFQRRFARVAGHAQAAQRLLNELAAQDLAACLDGESVDIEHLRGMDADRVDNLLRYWFSSRNVRMPSVAWLGEMRQQLLDAREDAQVRVTHADCEIRRHRGRIFLTSRRDGESVAVPTVLHWRGEARIHLPAFGGTLCFDEAEQGVDAHWLREHELLVRHRSGGEKLKAAPNRPTRSLKHHYQALDVPAWARSRLPVVVAGDYLLFAAGIGMNWREQLLAQKCGIVLRWEPDAS